jgi:hypothetical protein
MKLVNEMGHLALIIRADSQNLRETRDGRDGLKAEAGKAEGWGSKLRKLQPSAF